MNLINHTWLDQIVKNNFENSEYVYSIFRGGFVGK